MERYTVKLYKSSSRSDETILGTFNDKEEAANYAFDFAYDHGMTASCDKRDDVIEALVCRNYYMLAYGPRELEIEEVNS